MAKLLKVWRIFARWLAVEPDQYAGPRNSSSKAHIREWHRRQREALRKARDTQDGGRPD